MRRIIYATILFLFYACHKSFDIPANQVVLHGAAPIMLVYDTTKINLTDYFEYPEKIKEIIPPDHVQVVMNEEQMSILLILSEKTGITGRIRFTFEDYNYDVPVFRKNNIDVEVFPLIITDKIVGDTLYLKSRHPVTEWIAYVQNYKLIEPFIVASDNHVGIIIPEILSVLPQAKLCVWALNSTGTSNIISIPLEQGKVVVEPDNPEPVFARPSSDVYDCAIRVFPDPQKSFIQLDRSLRKFFQHEGISEIVSGTSGDRYRPEIIAYANGVVGIDKTCELSGKINKAKNAYDKLFQLLVFNATIPSCLGQYYRAEGDDVQVGDRYIYFAGQNGKDTIFRERCNDLNDLKHNSMPLMYGDFIPLRIEDHIYAYLRSYFGKSVVVVFNKKAEKVTLKLDLPEVKRDSTFRSLFHSRFSYNNSKLILDVPAHGAEIVYN